MSLKRLAILVLSVFLLGAFLHSTEGLAAFQDVPSSHQFNSAINYVQQEGIVSGYPDGTYQPDRILNRAEFTKIIIESRFDENTINSCLNRGGFYDQALFNDVEPGVWFEKYVCVAKQQGIIQGYDDGSFRPIQTIIFAEAAKIASESYGLRVGSGEPWFEPYLTRLASLDAVPSTLSSISDTVQRGIKDISRGEMADVIFRLRNINDQVTSDDGKFSISVPETALPRGIQANDISITRVSQDDGGLSEVNGAPMLFYRLEPDGTEFAEPVRFTIQTETVANTVPMVFLLSGDSFELIPEPIIEIDQQTRMAKLTAEINHFSEVAIGFSDFFEIGPVTLDPSGTQTADQAFSAEVAVQKSGTPTFVLQTNNQTVAFQPDWRIDNIFFENTPGALGAHYKRANTIQPQTGIDNYLVTTDFNCSATGSDSTVIEYQGEITWNFTFDGVPRTATSYIRSTSEPFRCEGEDPLALQYEQWRTFALNHINQLRAENGSPALQGNAQLDNIAMVHAEDMALNSGEVTHQGSLGEESYERILDGKVIDLNTNTYTTMPVPQTSTRSGENIGVRNLNFYNNSGEDAIANLHETFMTTAATGVSSRTTMLSTEINFSEVGIGFFLDNAGTLWIVEDFVAY